MDQRWERNRKQYEAAVRMVFSGEHDRRTVLELRNELHLRFVEEAREKGGDVTREQHWERYANEHRGDVHVNWIASMVEEAYVHVNWIASMVEEAFLAGFDAGVEEGKERNLPKEEYPA